MSRCQILEVRFENGCHLDVPHPGILPAGAPPTVPQEGTVFSLGENLKKKNMRSEKFRLLSRNGCGREQREGVSSETQEYVYIHM